MKKKQYTLLSVLLFCCLFGVESFAQFEMGAQIRPRSEFRNGFKTLTLENNDPVLFVEQRSRLWMSYNQSKYKVHINIQDVRMWGANSQIYKNDNTLFNVYEAWGEYRFSPKFSARMGRMALNYDNARFFGNLDWAQQGRSHDALLLKFKNEEKGFKLDVGAAYNTVGNEPTLLEDEFYVLNNYKTMQFLWANKKFGEKLNASLLVQNDGQESTVDSNVVYRQTIGVVPTYNTEKIKIGGEFYVQTGKNKRDQDVNALLVGLNFTYKTKRTPITVGVDYLSGTEVDELEEDNSFAPLYGTNHKFYGFMDYFYVGNGHSNVGLIDYYVKTKFKVNEKSNLMAHAHFFNTAVDVKDFEGKDADANLGTEIDLVYNLKLHEDVLLSVGYSHMLASETMEIIKGKPDGSNELNNWAWLQISFTPTFFKMDVDKK